jgi:hypothetical protein
VLCAATAALASTAARAHFGQEFFGRSPFVNDADEVTAVGGLTTWGLVLPDDDGGYARVCEEAIGPQVGFAVLQRARGRVLLGTALGLEATSDDGCSYALLDNPLRGLVPAAVAAADRPGEQLYVVTATPDVDNGLYVSADGGDTFHARGPLLPGSLTAIAIDAADEHGVAGGPHGSVVVAGARHDGRPLLARSTDGGSSFTALDALVAARSQVDAVLVLADGTTVVGGLDTTATGFVDLVDATGAVRSLPPLPRRVTHVVATSTHLFALARNGATGTLLSMSLDATDAGWQATAAGGPTECVFVVDDVLVGCGKRRASGMPLFVRSSDEGTTWETLVGFDDVAPRRCPADTAGTLLCPPTLERSCANGADDDLDGRADCEDDDCAQACARKADDDGSSPPGGSSGCALAPPALVGLAAFLPWLAWLRRGANQRRGVRWNSAGVNTKRSPLV